MGDVLITTWGPIGVVVVALAIAFKQLQHQLTESQERRVADAQGTTAKILELVEQHNESNQALALAINANTDAVRANNEAVRALEQRMNGQPTTPPYRRGG